jgi:hypothetical protein
MERHVRDAMPVRARVRDEIRKQDEPIGQTSGAQREDKKFRLRGRIRWIVHASLLTSRWIQSAQKMQENAPSGEQILVARRLFTSLKKRQRR